MSFFPQRTEVELRWPCLHSLLCFRFDTSVFLLYRSVISHLNWFVLHCETITFEVRETRYKGQVSFTL